MQPGIAPVLQGSHDDLGASAVIANVRHNVERLRAATPILSDMVAKETLRVVGGVYDLATGKVAFV